ncbi:MAG: 3,4-dihydroxy 2-butanone 4-phosphate synthase/GTP cyclohydrolase II [Cellvibrionaceae bacterium]|jgi:3,4-dihydroxy 2-butanone 4-phosphate synthase/GTP cyclohydrolase II
MALNTVEELVNDLRQGKMVILMDDEDRENEGDLVMVAEHVRAEDINFMATHARGLICLTLSEDRCRKLDLPLMVNNNRAQHATNFTLSIEAAEGVTTGISAADRAHTIRVAVGRDTTAENIVQPGHIFPLMAQPGGVLSRAGHTEAGCDLAKMAGFEAAAVIVEIMNADGTMARLDDLKKFAVEHDLKIGSIADLIHYRSVQEKTIELIQHRSVKTGYGQFQLSSFRDLASGDIHFALHKGEIKADEVVLVRVHVLDGVKDVLALQRAEDDFVPWTFQEAVTQVETEGKGVVVLMCYNQTSKDMEERIESILSGKTKKVTPDHVYRQVGTGAQILRELGVTKMRLMSAPFKFSAISGFDLEVVDVVDSPNHK